MVRIKPFKAYRANPQYVQQIISPPYDVIDYEESKEIAEKNGDASFIHIIRSEVDFKDPINPYSEEVYQKAKKNLEEFINKQYLIQENEEVFFVYQLQWRDHIQSGIVGLNHIDDYLNNIIKKHEFTRPDKEEDRFRHIDITGFNCEPVFFTFKSKDARELESFINTIITNETLKIYDVIDDANIRHKIYRISGDSIKTIQNYFQQLECLYIADGHHRTASTVKAGLKRREKDKNSNPEKPYNYFLSVTFPSNQLKILPYNRVVKDINHLSKDDFLKRIQEKYFLNSGKSKELKLHEFHMFFDNQWYHLTLKPEFLRKSEIDDLDVSYLQDYILDPVLGIKDPRTSERISFVGGIRGDEELEKLVMSRKYEVAFSLYPTPIESLFRVSDAGKVMPPKSTWFEPKLKSGFFLNKIQEN